MEIAAQRSYSKKFFDEMETGALQSARAVLPMVFDLLAPRSIVDIGCGRGAWLRVAMDPGMLAEGLDGAYVDRGDLLIPQDRFLEADLSRPFQTPRCYDLAPCLEVAEHLPYKAARSLISELTAAAPAVLFSAAIPGQPGTRHINPQFPEYWQKLFAEHGYVALDALRPRIYSDARVEPWYAQNMLLYVARPYYEQMPGLHGYRPDRRPRPIIAVGLWRNLAWAFAVAGPVERA
jgi:hypothetical protein